MKKDLGMVVLGLVWYLIYVRENNILDGLKEDDSGEAVIIRLKFCWGLRGACQVWGLISLF